MSQRFALNVVGERFVVVIDENHANQLKFYSDPDDHLVLRSFSVFVHLSDLHVPQVDRQRFRSLLVDPRREPFPGDIHRINRHNCVAICDYD